MNYYPDGLLVPIIKCNYLFSLDYDGVRHFYVIVAHGYALDFSFEVQKRRAFKNELTKKIIVVGELSHFQSPQSKLIPLRSRRSPNRRSIVALRQALRIQGRSGRVPSNLLYIPKKPSPP